MYLKREEFLEILSMPYVSRQADLKEQKNLLSVKTIFTLLQNLQNWIDKNDKTKHSSVSDKNLPAKRPLNSLQTLKPAYFPESGQKTAKNAENGKKEVTNGSNHIKNGKPCQNHFKTAKNRVKTAKTRIAAMFGKIPIPLIAKSAFRCGAYSTAIRSAELFFRSEAGLSFSGDPKHHTLIEVVCRSFGEMGAFDAMLAVSLLKSEKNAKIPKITDSFSNFKFPETAENLLINAKNSQNRPKPPENALEDATTTAYTFELQNKHQEALERYESLLQTSSEFDPRGSAARCAALKGHLRCLLRLGQYHAVMSHVRGFFLSSENGAQAVGGLNFSAGGFSADFTTLVPVAEGASGVTSSSEVGKDVFLWDAVAECGAQAAWRLQKWDALEALDREQIKGAVACRCDTARMLLAVKKGEWEVFCFVCFCLFSVFDVFNIFIISKNKFEFFLNLFL